MTMITNCPNCGAPLEILSDRLSCRHCGTQVALRLLEPTPAEAARVEPPLAQAAAGEPAPEKKPEERPASYQDNFSDPGSGWPVSANLDCTFKYAEGGYHILTARVPSPYLGVNEPFQPVVYAALPEKLPDQKRFHNLELEVRMTLLEGSPDCHFGVILRQGSPESGYLAAVNQAGECRLEKWSGGTWTALTGWSAAPEDDESGAFLLQARCEGRKITLRLNGQEVHAVEDDTYGKGRFGLFAGKFRYSGPFQTQVVFNDFKAWPLS